MQPHRRRRSSATPFLPPPGKPKDISLIDNADELLGLLRRTNEQLTRYVLAMSPSSIGSPYLRLCARQVPTDRS